MTATIKQKLDKEKAKILAYHGCMTGDCPHDKQTECFESVFDAAVNLLMPVIELCMEQRRRMTYNELTEDERKLFFANKMLDKMDAEILAAMGKGMK